MRAVKRERIVVVDQDAEEEGGERPNAPTKRASLPTSSQQQVNTQSVLNAWSSYVSNDGKPMDSNIFSAQTTTTTSTTSTVTPLESVQVRGRITSSMHDNTFLSVTNASVHLMKRTGQGKVASRLDQQNKHDIAERAQQQEVRLMNKKRAAPTATPPPPATPTAQTSTATGGLGGGGVDAVAMLSASVVHSMEDHRSRDANIFNITTVERPSMRAPKVTIIRTPPIADIIERCAALKDTDNSMMWYKHMSSYVADNPDITLPKTPTFIHSVLVTFLREPDPKCPYERPCKNLDRNPQVGEATIRCVAHALSEEQLGPGKGFRCRELLYNDQQLRIIHAQESGVKDVRKLMQLLPAVQEMCFMCHVWMTTKACLDQKNRADIHKLQDLTQPQLQPPQPPPQVMLFNRFMVDIDKVGEYDRNAMLPGEIGLGIYGPFPQWNKNNYFVVTLKPSGLRGFQEHARMFFQAAPAPSLRI